MEFTKAQTSHLLGLGVKGLGGLKVQRVLRVQASGVCGLRVHGRASKYLNRIDRVPGLG